MATKSQQLSKHERLKSQDFARDAGSNPTQGSHDAHMTAGLGSGDQMATLCEISLETVQSLKEIDRSAGLKAVQLFSPYFMYFYFSDFFSRCDPPQPPNFSQAAVRRLAKQSTWRACCSELVRTMSGPLLTSRMLPKAALDILRSLRHTIWRWYSGT